MCGRFLHTAPIEAVRALFDVAVEGPPAPPRYNIAPGQPIGVIAQDGSGARTHCVMRWGFCPAWAKPDSPMAKAPLINARGETAFEKPSFRDAWRKRRCLIPATGFYEWQGPTSRRQPILLTPHHGGLIAFAGLWETQKGPDGAAIDGAAIVTMPAGPDIAPLHDREPVLIAPEAFSAWLFMPESAFSLMQPAPAGFWRQRAVAPIINQSRRDGPELAQELGIPDFGAGHA